MLATIQKWGDSKAIRLPKVLLNLVDLNENDEVEIKVVDGNIIISPKKRHKTLKDRIGEYEGDYIM